MKRIAVSIAVLVAMAGTAMADGDAAKGEKIFNKCKACHSAEDKTNKVGPYLFGVVDRPVATAEGYNYSDGMKEYGATGAKWDMATLDTYLKDPKAVVPKTKMSFTGLKKDDERADIIAFLATKK